VPLYTQYKLMPVTFLSFWTSLIYVCHKSSNLRARSNISGVEAVSNEGGIRLGYEMEQ